MSSDSRPAAPVHPAARPLRLRILTAIGAAVVLGVIATTTTAPMAWADPVSDAVSALAADPLYVAPDTGDVTVSSPAGVRSALAGSSVKVVVLKAGAGNPVDLARQIGQQVDGGNVTVGVFVGTAYGAGSHVLGSGCAGVAISRAVDENITQLRQTRDLTATIERFARLAESAPKSGSCSSATSSAAGRSTSGSSATSGWAVLGVIGVIAAGAVGGLLWRRRRRERRSLAAARATIQPYYDRLAADVGSLQPGNNPTARQALSDASERFNSAGSQLSTAASLAEFGGARRSVLEGLQAARTARVALGLDPGPDLPPLVDTPAPQLETPQQLSVNGQPVQGYPQYQPGAPYYFAGGGGYAGGWYSMPFWQTLLIAEALSPGWGWGFGGWGGGGYGLGYDSGFASGFEQGEQSSDGAGGGDWSAGGDGSAGGGDWSGGGGDWSGGGGDWSGGGGDWGGGDSSGGGGDW